ncbi:terpenoid synthase [Parathielavia hyrcaniae]|uniref:Terpenoid synthase n=1 Tax=Parathielavia hyrcaniae TaxID=113614 RepID=A0AAN6T4G0_9PEZI|nr:terpenoid synthase [Parathielavia hyrcaniae]
MNYPNSDIIPPSAYDTSLDGLCGNIPLRVNRHPELADRGALRAQRDWKRAFGSLPPGFAGTMGPKYNFVSTCTPEVLPDRLELVAYVTEMTFLMDDMIDADAAGAPNAVAAPYMADFLQAYNVVMGGEMVDAASCSPVARMIIDACMAMRETDPQGAKTAFGWLSQWTKVMLGGSESDRGKECQSLDEYLQYRRVDVASDAAFGLWIFGMGLHIPEDQQKTCLELSRPFWLQFSLANDCHSWDHEQKAAKVRHVDGDAGDAFVPNAIWVSMHRHAMTSEQAQAACRIKAKEYADEYLQVIESLPCRGDLCQDAKFLLDALQFGMSGNVVWGLQAPRYRGEREYFTPSQLEIIKELDSDETVGQELDSEHAQKPPVHDTPKHSPAGTHHEVVNGVGQHDMAHAAVQDAPALGIEILEGPSRYLTSLPGKGIRDRTVHTLNSWFQLSPDDVESIKKIINLLHGASLMMDDIQDSSQLRRGKPATHMVFGPMQTINAAGNQFLDALHEVQKLSSPRCMEIFCGQSHDLWWICNLECPTEADYLAMIDSKTAGLFRMLARLMDAKSTSAKKPDVTLLTRFMNFLGRLFQIRDDYMNLTSADYTEKKGFCEDLDEGKYSLPVIHALGRSGGDRLGDPATCARAAVLLRNLLAQRHVAGRMSLDQKKLFLEQLERLGSFEYTRRALDALQVKLEKMGEELGILKDKGLRDLLDSLKVATVVSGELRSMADRVP